MDWQLRIALLIAGCALIGYIYFDYSKKKKLNKENDKLKKQFDGITESVDSAGFDHAGVGVPRPASDINSLNDDGLATVLEGTSVESFINQRSDEKQQRPEQQDTNNVIADVSDASGEGIEDVITGSADENNNGSSDVEPNTSNEAAMVLSLILQAPDGTQFKGKDFLPLLLSQGLRHGEMGIFHRRMRTGNSPGPVLFSLANGIAPGTFDLSQLDVFETPALALFMTLPGPEDAQVAYNAMYTTCTLLQKEIGGDILDETKSVYSKQTHNHRLDQIKDYSFKIGI